ncbi:MAG: hypothetical protein RLY31_2083 [Bacteroidota bacterium]
MNNNRNHGRRTFLRQSALVSIGFLALSRCTQAPVGRNTKLRRPALLTDPLGYLDLPEGFEYRIISRMGEGMEDGFLVPGRADGMGTFPGSNGRVILIRNHENSPQPASLGPFGPDNERLAHLDPARLYDAGRGGGPGQGGTTTLVYDEATGRVERSFLSLAGTYRNCAGGVTPWNSWLTCEEDTTLSGATAEKDHGYVFEVPASEQPGLADPQPIKAMGRFNHEAVCVDPATSIVYLTEDRGDGLIYRYLPVQKGQLHAGGRLQALAVTGRPQLDTRNWIQTEVSLHTPLAVEWVDIRDVESPADDLRHQGFEKGAARFARGEGMWFGQGELFFACTNGGPGKTGQVFRYRPSGAEGTPQEKVAPGVLELFAESPDRSVLHACDNLTIAPWGDVILCEDNGERNYIRGIDRNGAIYDFACNRGSTSEFAGLVFSPSGKTLFVNIQESGETLAITGPWEQLTGGQAG